MKLYIGIDGGASSTRGILMNENGKTLDKVIINKGSNLNYLYLVLSGLVFANFFHSGSGPIILIIFTSIFLILLFYSHLINNLKIFFNIVLSLILGNLISL